MTTCGALGITPLTAAATGLTLYYDSNDICYTSSTGVTPVGAVQINTDASTAVIQFTPQTGASALPLTQLRFCGDGNDQYQATISTSGGDHTLTLTLPSTEDLEWGWEFGPEKEDPQQTQQSRPLQQAIKIKVRVIRI